MSPHDKRQAYRVNAVFLPGSGWSPSDFNDIGEENRVVPNETTLEVKDGKVSLPAHSLVIW
ncbi:MAG: hypothetical protein LBT46_15570 [Planctomycetaceae bacterium]|jgi:hypothetical protein|nr:hypothetical protein [Planctomycetaceae bacterium]